jgi:periplasmic protein TonB
MVMLSPDDSSARFRYTRSHRGNQPGFLGDYRTRMMFALAGSLAFVLAVTHLPVQMGVGHVGWRVVQPNEFLSLEQLGLEQLARATPEVPITTFDNALQDAADGEDDFTSADAAVEEGEETPKLERSSEPVRLAARQAVLEFSEHMPQIVGGLGAYYINIQYPEAAAKAGVQGRLVLEFVVEPTGKPGDIRIAESLHPLCDSAAVRALRETRFVPGRHEGKEVRVRMRLPVRFQLVERPRAPGAVQTSQEAGRRGSSEL